MERVTALRFVPKRGQCVRNVWEIRASRSFAELGLSTVAADWEVADPTG
jgi:hypothetical protein